jgi:hypothetical protein
MPKTAYDITTDTYTITTPNTATSAFEADWHRLADQRDIATSVLNREFPPELREFLIWLVNNDPYISAKFTAFKACVRIGVRTK